MMHNFKNADKKSGTMIVGLILLGIGCLLLLKSFNLMFFPGWIFSFPVVLIGIGTIIGLRKGFRRPAPQILIILGTILLAHKILPGDSDRFIWPVAIIGIGLWIILKPSKYYGKDSDAWDKRVDQSDPLSDSADYQFDNKNQNSFQERLDAVSIFGGVKKNITSKNFKGGDIVNIFGGSEINLTQADINGTIRLEVVQVFGGTKIILPANWTIHSEMAAIFGGIEDKRPVQTAANPDKVLIIEGVSIFGGIDIRSF
ncbi:LiaF transmembrane domain-containing protein [Daejeonella oryzae]|uniref:LiaF transmembrane domain-containing protein n=1 Tax=Daejeonella oryzae TaxID=1122943 RepID=UPI0006840869|nr:LiaF domain-containing protein [Daejeonella oryzae]